MSGMQRLMTALAISLVLITALTALADFPADGGFEQPATWTAVGEGTQMDFDTGHAARGRQCLRLRGWALSQPAEEVVGGWLRLRLMARPVGGAGCRADLALALVTDAASPPHPQITIGPAQVGKRYQAIITELFAPMSPELRVAVGVLGDGEWLVDEVSVSPAPQHSSPDASDPPVYPEPLPVDWAPDGTLDATERNVADEVDMVVSVGGLEVSIPAHITQQRGVPDLLPVTVANRGGAPRSLTVSVQGPPGVAIPERTVPVRSAGGLEFKMSTQAPLVGEYWLRIELRCGDDVKAAPLRVTGAPGYPTPIAVWDGEPPAPEAVQKLAGLGVGMYQVIGGVGELTASLPALPAGAQLTAMIEPPWSTETVDAAVAAAGQRAAFMALHLPREAAPPENAVDLTAHLAAALKSAGPAVWAFTPPVDVTGDAEEEALSAAGELAAQGTVAAPQLRLPPLPPATVRSVRVGKRVLEGPLSSWVELAERTDLTATANVIRARARLPLLVSEVCGGSTGSPELDALSLARVMVTSIYQGVTGFGLYARPEDCPEGATALSLLDESGAPRPAVAEVFATLGRELAGAVPLTVLEQDERFGLSPQAEIGYRPFLRGDHGVVAVWNNTADVADVFVEVRATPLDMLTIEITPEGMTSSYSPIFRFCQEAHDLGRPIIPLHLAPGQMTVLSMQLARAFVGWLGPIQYRPENPEPSNTPLEEYLRRIEESKPR